MTAQISDHILFEGRHFSLASEPLAAWLDRRKNRHLRFRRTSTACSRGYGAAWEVARGRLYLTKFVASLADGTPASMETLFANYTDQFYASVNACAPENAGPGRFAFWFTGMLRCPMGKQLAYRHYGYGSIFERDLCLCFKDGYLIGSRIVDNRPLSAGNRRLVRRLQSRLTDEDFVTDEDVEEQVLERQIRRHWASLTWP
jgi:hypothetical protein